MDETKKYAIIVSLNDDTSEIVDLTNSLNYEVKKIFIQHKTIPDTKTYIGSGKLEEIKDFIKSDEVKINLIVIDGELKPSQWFVIEKELGINVYDRVRLILAIFEERADKREAKLQVKLAQLHYERPFVKELIHRARANEHPGYMAGGEYQVDDYYEMIKKNIKKIKEQLESIREQRELHRKHRHKGGFYLISLAGYTNAGKSSLLNLLTDEKVKVEGRLFSTLSTTTRKIKNDVPLLITDTVGFIQNLPAFIIDAFHSTLEEIEVADVVLLVIDISEEPKTIEKKLKVCLDELVEIGVSSQVIFTFNKIDLISNEELKNRIKYLNEKNLIKEKLITFISVKNKKNINNLLDLIFKTLPQSVDFVVKLPLEKKTNSIVSWIYEKASVEEIIYNDFVTIKIKCNKVTKDKIISRCSEIKGAVIY